MNHVDSNQKQGINQMTAFVYFGKRGGGVYLTRDFAKDMFRVNYKLILAINSDGELVNETKDSLMEAVYPFSTPSVIEFLFNPVLRYKFKKNLRNFFLERKVRQIIITMPHYTDLLISKICRSLSIRTGIIVHDFKNHPGDFWPRKFTIYRRIKSFNQTFVLSQYMRSLLKNKYKIDALAIDFPPNSRIPIVKPNKVVSEPYFLILGRMKRYKGVSEFAEIWGKHKKDDFPVLVIAGEGAPSFRNRKVITINEWLSEDKIINLLRNCSGVLLPYTEASQSGIVDLAMQLNVNIFLFSVGGLSEQIMNYPLGQAFRPNDYKSLLESLNTVKPRELELPLVSYSQKRNEPLRTFIGNGF